MMKSRVRRGVLMSLMVIALARAAAAQSAGNETVVFVCEHGAAKSVIATAYFNKLAAEPACRIAPSIAARIRKRNCQSRH